jgi:hypothetical protein
MLVKAHHPVVTRVLTMGIGDVRPESTYSLYNIMFSRKHYLRAPRHAPLPVYDVRRSTRSGLLYTYLCNHILHYKPLDDTGRVVDLHPCSA